MMKSFLIIWTVLFSVSSFAQDAHQTRSLKVLEINEFQNCYLITSYDSSKTERVYLLSLKDTITKICEWKKINVGEVYRFQIDDMDNTHGHLPAALPNGYYFKIGNQRIKRDGRNGATVTTTQFLATNAKGLWIEEMCGSRGTGSSPCSQ